jgi:hypothetical protein
MEFLPAAAQILRDDVLSKYKVNIQTNSLTQADWALEKEQRMELVNTIGQMIGQTTELAKDTPELAMLGVQLIKFAIAGYKAGTELEGWIDKQLDEMARSAMQAKEQPPEPSAEEQKMQMEMQMKQQDAQMKQQENASKMQMEEQKMQMEMQLEQARMQMDLQMKQAELAHKERMAALDFQIKQLELQVKQQSASIDMGIKEESAALDLETKKAAGEQQLKQSAEMAKQKPKDKK